MLGACLVAALASAAPKVPEGARGFLYIPNLENAAPVRALLSRAGDKASLLKPELWETRLLTLVAVNLGKPDTLRTAGLSPGGWLTVSSVRDLPVVCLELADGAAFRKSAAARLAELGEPWTGKESGLALVGARVNGNVVAGYVEDGAAVCTVTSKGGEALPILQAAAKGLRKNANVLGADKLSGVMFLVSPQAQLAIARDGNALIANGRASKTGLPPLSGGPSPYAQVRGAGVATAKLRLPTSAVPRLATYAQATLTQLCPTCDSAAVRAVTSKIAPLLSGAALLHVAELKTQGGLGSQSKQYFALKHAYLAHAKSADAVKKALGSLAKWPNASPDRGGFRLSVPNGQLWVGVEDAHLYFANNSEALDGALAALAGGRGEQKNGLELTVDPTKAAVALGRISLMDVMGSPDLASVFAVGIELGPLLRASRAVNVSANGSAPLTFQVRWELSDG